MGLIALLMTGAVLLMNGLVLLQIAEPRTVAIVNIWGGILQTLTPFVLLTQTHTPVEALGVGPPFLFGLTFLWVGVATLMDLPTVAIGWYCLWVVPVTVVLAIANVTIFADPRFAIVWLNYGMLWGLFWAVLALGRVNLARFTGWTAVFLAVWRDGTGRAVARRALDDDSRLGVHRPHDRGGAARVRPRAKRARDAGARGGPRLAATVWARFSASHARTPATERSPSRSPSSPSATTRRR